MKNYVPNTIWPKIWREHDRVPTPVAHIVDPENENYFIVDPTLQPVLDEMLDALDAGESYRKAADWLKEKLGRYVSHSTVQGMWKRVRSNDKGNPRVAALRKMKKSRAPKSKLEAKEQELKRSLAYAKQSMTIRQKKLEEFKESVEPQPITPSVEYESTNEDTVPQFDGREVIFQPHPGPQEAFLAAEEQEVLYGGAAGGGKSYAMLADPMRYFGIPEFNGLLVRRTNDELKELKQKSKLLYPRAYPGAKWREQDSMWTFPSGAQFWMTYLESDDDVQRYQGQAFTWIGFDELTHWPTPYCWNYMRTRLRSAKKVGGSKIPLYMRATTNPGGVGHGWVKRMFIDPAPFGVPFAATDIETGKPLLWKKGPKAGQPLFQRRFIPAKLSDNPSLAEDGEYEANLLSQGDAVQRQLLEGDWNVADGAAFPEFRNSIHVCKPFDIPKEWRRFRSCDYGYNSWSAVHWYAIDPNFDTLYVYRELYVTKKTGHELSLMIQELEHYERVDYGMLDSSVWHQRGQTGPSIAEEMIAAGTKWKPADRSSGSRANGKNRLHELLKVTGEDDYAKPGIIFFDNCRQIISDLPMIPADPKGTDDINKDYASDHAYDSIRYGIMSRPRATTPWDFGPGPTGWKPVSRRFGY